MKKIIITGLLLVFTNLIFAQKFEKKIIAEKANEEVYFDTIKVEDPYRFLENVEDKDVQAWVRKQNRVSQKYLNACKRKADLVTKLDFYQSYGYKEDLSVKDVYPKIRKFAHSSTSEGSLYYALKKGQDYRLLVNPLNIGGRGKKRIVSYYFNKDRSKLAYTISRNGTDWREVRVFDFEKERRLQDKIKDVRYSSILWRGNGFYYKKFDRAEKFDKASSPKIYYHRIGTSQEEDILMFERKNNPSIQLDFQVTDDERYLIISEFDEKLDMKSYYFYDFNETKPRIRPLVRNTKSTIKIVGENPNNKKWIASVKNKDSKSILVEIDPKNTKTWREIVPAYDNSNMTDVNIVDDGIFVVFKEKLKSVVTFYNYDGELLYTDVLPIASNLSKFVKSEEDGKYYYTIQSYTVPSVFFELNIKTFEKKLNQKTHIAFDSKNIKYKEVYVPSRDGKEIPAIMVYDEEFISKDKPNPLLIDTYGGFGLVVDAKFDPKVVHFIKSGGIYVFAHIRGSGGFGESWKNDGKNLKKQNAINDLIDVSEYLIKENHTSPDKLAIKGGSHGGFIVAAAGIQRPDLFKVVVPMNAPLDILRKEKFSVGSFHLDEYGTVTKRDEFENMYKISPYHNIKEGVNYPTMLLITSDNDDRVPPFHSYKFVAKLLRNEKQTNPILLKVAKKAGHHGATSYKAAEKERAEHFSFIMSELGMIEK
ncbi:prolyl oligopeptidase family serine peptidase [Aureivirga sp. CE67]|uniref:prolyl oligopeptidase family serine peptidase n=1 Tax=Aureivirga sp. CE67 TaxID=1788983 RepID=UPI0018C8FBEE|nr:prolyl oligopeptidase family serine peptidase [Aureivirga sp. CE67]